MRQQWSNVFLALTHRYMLTYSFWKRRSIFKCVIFKYVVVSYIHNRFSEVDFSLMWTGLIEDRSSLVQIMARSFETSFDYIFIVRIATTIVNNPTVVSNVTILKITWISLIYHRVYHWLQKIHNPVTIITIHDIKDVIWLVLHSLGVVPRRLAPGNAQCRSRMI